MASEELARKLQSRLVATWEDEPRPEPVQSLAQPNPQEAEAACGESSSELSAKLIRRQDINEGNAAPRLTRIFNPYTEFKEFSRKQIKDMEMMFKRYDTGKDGFIDLMELKLMMEKLGAPQTHLGLKNMIKEVDEDFDGKLSFREVNLPPRGGDHDKLLKQREAYWIHTLQTLAPKGLNDELLLNIFL
ncbi:EF-hand domain-containing protein D2 isoform X7 [Epinephelus lanceolatus]